MTFKRDTHHRSQVLVHSSWARIASAHEVLAHARRSLARQRYLKVVCAWCTRTLRWRRAAAAARGQISHSICRACTDHLLSQLPPACPCTREGSRDGE